MEQTKTEVTIEDKVAYLRLNNPPANALSTELLTELSSVMDELEQNEDAQVVVITGNGKFFSAGADIEEFTGAFGDAEKGRKMSEKGQGLCNKIEDMEKPVIAAIDGHCLGGGLELAMGCHLRFAKDEAKMGLPELNLGLIPSFGGTQRLAKLTNQAKALELILSSQFIKGEKAKEVGLVNEVYPADQLMDQVENFAKAIANTKSSVSVTKAIKAVLQGSEEALQEGLSRETQYFGELFEAQDSKEGIQAFLEKREPEFKNQ